MFFQLSKILDFLLSPLVWIGLLLLAALVIRNARRSRKLLISAFVFFMFFTNSFITDEFMRWSERPMISDANMLPYDAGIVLGGGMVTSDAASDRLIFQQNPDRIMQAVRLYKQGKIKKLLISSGSGSIVFPDMLEAALLARYLREIGIPAQDILVDSVSRNTYENAVESARILRDSLPNGRYLLITSALHMPRAQACFLKQGVIADPYPVGKKAGDRRWDIGFLLVPDVNNLMSWDKMLHEWTGTLIYRFKGYI